ncbi:MAG: phytanoyl-CoA dioxygenase family protein [Opitutales bacterium]
MTTTLESPSVYQTTPETLTPQQIADYRENGFVRLKGVISPKECATFRDAATTINARAEADGNGGRAVFNQFVNNWRESEALRGLTLHPNITALARTLAGIALRLWHDHLLVKKPHNNAPTHFHQDQPYWPHANSAQPLSAWVALNDVPVERGCMTFIPKSQRYTELTAQNLHDAGSLFDLCPELQWDERVTLPLRAGDCTFHHGRCAHMANDNLTDEHRYGYAIIYIDRTTTFAGRGHVVTKPLVEAGQLKEGDLLEGELFPEI